MSTASGQMSGEAGSSSEEVNETSSTECEPVRSAAAVDPASATSAARIPQITAATDRAQTGPNVVLGSVSATTVGELAPIQATAEEGRLEPAVDKPSYKPLYAILDQQEDD